MLKYIEKANKIHNNKYDYSNVEYVNMKTKVKIICPIHGEFQQTLDLHLNSKCGCPKCAIRLQQQPKNIVTVLAEANKIHNNYYSYNENTYLNSTTKFEIFCPKHGSFWQSPSQHIKRKQGCPSCKGIKTSIRCKKSKYIFTQEANKVHNNKYDYTLSEYINSHTKTKIICKEHGEFSQRPSSHLTGNGCKLCALDKTGWTTKERFKNRCKKLGIFYIIKCYNENEEFYKLGITSRSIKERYGNNQHMPYQYKIIQEIKDLPDTIWELESYLKKFIKSFNLHYIPDIKFGGHLSECFVLQQNH